MTNLLSISNTLKSTLTTATIANDIDIDTTTITTAAELTSTPISRATTDTNNAFAIALQQAQIMAVTFAEAAEAVADAVLVATELLHAVDMQDIANIMEMNKAVASSTSFAISAITDALRTANSSCAALSKADMTREFAIATVLNILSQQSTIPQLSTQSPSAPSPSPAPSSSNIGIDQTIPQSLTTSNNSSRSPTVVAVDNPQISSITLQPHRECRKQSSTTDPVLSTIKHGHLYNISSADDTSIIIRGPASFVASKLYDTPNANTDIDMAVQVVFEALFELFWKSVPMEFRRQPYPTDRRLKQWKLGDVERSIGPLHYVTSNMSWDQWCRRYFPRQNDAEMPTGLRARFLDTFKLQRKRFSGSRLHEFDSEIRRQFHQLDIVPAMVKNKTIWSKQKMLVDKREIFKLRAIKRPRH